MKVVASLKDSLLNIAFPQGCHSCRAAVESSYFGPACENCWSRTKFIENETPACSKCGVLLEVVTSDHCPDCREHHYDLAGSVGLYENALVAAVLNLKRVPVIPPILIDQIRPTLELRGLEEFDVVVPIPLSSKRRIERGFNQAEVIGSTVSRLTHIPTDYHSLVRMAHTPLHRAAMDRKAREITVKNAFEVRRPNLVKGKAVLLVDDILTSGATVSNCAKVLKNCGTAKVGVFTLARAQLRSPYL